MGDFADHLIRRIAEYEDEKKAATAIPVDIQIARLQEFAERYHSKNPWKVGDLVVVMEDAPIQKVGDVSVVIKAQDKPLFDFVDEPGNWSAGVCYNTQIVTFHKQSESCVPFILPHWALREYVAE